MLGTKIINGRWFGTEGGLIRPRSISQEFLLVAEKSGNNYKEISPKAAFSYIILNGDAKIVNLNPDFFDRGMVLTFINETGVDSEIHVDGNDTNIIIGANARSAYLINADHLFIQL